MSETLGSKSGVAPVLISGVYRSGTTFLTAVINSLPNFAAASSTVKYLRFCAPVHRELDDPACLDSLLEETAARVKARWGLDLDCGALRKELADQEKTHANVYDAMMRALLLDGDQQGPRRWAEKLAMQWRDIPAFLEMFPEGQAVHVVRDPRDVTSSYKKMTYEPWPTFMDAALNCKAAMIDLPRLQGKFGHERILVVRAEDFATDLPASMARLCDFLGEPFNSEFADADNFPAIKGEDWRTNSSFDEEGRNFAEAAPRWRDHLTPEELFLIEMICQPEMTGFGYPGSGQDLSALDAEALGALLADPWLASRLGHYLATGLPQQGYRSDPYTTEMEIVFGDRGKEA